METKEKPKITIEVLVNGSAEKIWKLWTVPEHITKWNFASDDWHSPFAENDLKPGGKFKFRMEAKDGSFGFEFGGTYDRVVTNQSIEYTLEDNRKVYITFSSQGNQTKIIETFEAESENPVEMQKGGWQAILNNFKKHAEENH